MKKDPEKKIEDFLFENPYILGRYFSNIIPERQEKNGRCRTDLTFRKNGVLTIVEIKRGVINKKDIRQLQEYIKLFSENDTVSENHFLVGKRPGNADILKNVANLNEIRFLFLGIDIPLRYLYDSLKRKYIPFDENIADQKRYWQNYYFHV